MTQRMTFACATLELVFSLHSTTTHYDNYNHTQRLVGPQQIYDITIVKPSLLQYMHDRTHILPISYQYRQYIFSIIRYIQRGDNIARCITQRQPERLQLYILEQHSFHSLLTNNHFKFQYLSFLLCWYLVFNCFEVNIMFSHFSLHQLNHLMALSGQQRVIPLGKTQS